MEVFLVLLAAALIFGPLVLLLILFSKVSTLEDKVKQLTAASAQPRTAPPVPQPAAQPAAAAATPVVATPPPLVPAPAPAVKRVATPPPAASTAPAADPFEALRDMGLLPPSDLKGEFALGSWWAVRVGGALAVAAVVFLGIWLNLRSTLPAWVRLGQIVLLGAVALWGGHRLERTRRDLGRIVFAGGLTVFQFAAWATHGMEKMRVLDSAAQAAALQFAVALLVGAVALARADKLIGQLSIVFTAVAVALSVHAGAEPLTIALEAASIAALGAVLLSRGGWASSAVLGLLGSIVGLLVLYDDRPVSAEVSQALQLGAGLVFLSLWLADRFGRVESGWPEARKNLFLCVAFFAPAIVGIWVSVGGDEGRFMASGLVALLALAIGAVELARRRLAAEVILSSSLLFAASSAAWKVEQRMVWTVWILAAALAQLAYARFRSVLLVWISEVLVVAGLFSFVGHPPKEPWLRLMAVAVVAGLAAWRFDWDAERPSVRTLRRAIGLFIFGLFVLHVQDGFPKVDQPWAWLVALPAAFLFRQPRLLYALIPSVAWTHFTVLLADVDQGGVAVRWPMVWAAVLVAFDLIGVWALNRLETAVAKVAQVVLAVLGVLCLVKSLDAGLRLDVVSASTWKESLLWVCGSALVFALGWALERLTARPYVAFAAQLAFLPAFLLNFRSSNWSDLALPQTPLLLIGLAVGLYGASRFGTGAGEIAPYLRGVFAFACGVLVFVGFDALPGAGVSLFWALAAAVAFLLGFVLKVRSYRLLGLCGLVVATGHVIVHDVRDILGRIVACAAVAIAFFAVAWLYGRITSERKDP